MASAGRSFDIIHQIRGNIVNFVKKRDTICMGPGDGWVLKMHYNWSFWLFLGGFSSVWYSWFHRDVITCVSHFSAENQVRVDYLNICLSYPFVTDGHQKRYLMAYRWIHWSFLLMAGAFYLPRKLAKNNENKKVKQLFEDLAKTAGRYDGNDKEPVEKVSLYLTFNRNTHNALYIWFVLSHVFSLLIDIIVFFFIDFLLQGKFVTYGIDAYPFHRDPRNFTDPMSQVFPPFAKCTLHRTTELTNQRTEEFGCHLTVMELYEKIFLLTWFWLILLITITIAYIVYLLLLFVPYVRKTVLRISKPITSTTNIRDTVTGAVQESRIGEIYLLIRLKEFYSHTRFYDLLKNVSDPAFKKSCFQSVVIDPTVIKGGQKVKSEVKQRKGQKKGNQNEGMTSSQEEMPQQIMHVPQAVQMPPQQIMQVPPQQILHYPQMPQIAPQQMPQAPSQQMPQHAPQQQMPQHAPQQQMPQHAPQQQMPQHAPQQQMPQQAPQQKMPQHAPQQQMPQHAPQQMPQHAPQQGGQIPNYLRTLLAH